MAYINTTLVLGMATSLYINYLFWKRFKVEKEEKKDIVMTKMWESQVFSTTIDSKEKIIKKQEASLKEYRKTNENLKISLDDKIKQYDELEVRYEEEKKNSKEHFESYYDQLNNSEKFYGMFLKKEEELYNLDWAYDELMKAYNSNALDLYFWNLLRSADRETRRKFIKSGKYRVCSLEDGRVMFEVI